MRMNSSTSPLPPPARKIRRLDVVLLSIVEEEEPVLVIPLVFNQQVRDKQLDTSMIEVKSMMPNVNDEKALVLYKPVDDREFSVSLDVMSGIMNQYLLPRTPVNNCLAMVPWQAPFRAPVDMPPEEEQMDAEVTETSSMETRGREQRGGNRNLLNGNLRKRTAGKQSTPVIVSNCGNNTVWLCSFPATGAPLSCGLGYRRRCGIEDYLFRIISSSS